MNPAGILNILTATCLAAGIWRHDWITIVASIGLLLMWRLIGQEVAEEFKCTGCRKGAMMPGCPVHDPQRRTA